MKIKVIQTQNYSKTYIVLKEEADLYHYINEEGELSQAKRDKMSIDSEVTVDPESVYRVFNEYGINLYSAHAQLEYLMKYLAHSEKENVERLFHWNMSAYHKSHICFEDLEKKAHMLCYYAHFQTHLQRCEIDIYEHHLNFLREGKEQIVLFVMEEFGTFYVNGVALWQYLFKCPAKRKNGKRFWTVLVDYDKLVRVHGEHTFHQYSDNIQYLKKVQEKHLHRAQLAQEGLRERDNVVDIHAIRDVQDIFKRIRDKKAGFRVVREGPLKEKRERS